MKNIRLIFNLFFLYVFISLANCKGKTDEKGSVPESKQQTDSVWITETKYARGFKIKNYPDYKIIEVPTPWEKANLDFEYLLLQRGAPVPKHDEKTTIVQIPVQSLVCLSTSHLPPLEMIGEEDKLTGFPNTGYITSPKVTKRVEQGKVQDIGPGGTSINLETLINLNPELVMAFSLGDQYSYYSSIKRTGIPVVMNADYLEASPLARAEWVKFMAAFFNKEKEAEKAFAKIEAKYDSLSAIAQKVKNRPTLFTGIVYGDAWFMAGGKSWSASLFEKAGGDYLWRDNETDRNLEISFEAVYEKARNADFWIGVASYNSLDEIAKADKRYTEFKAFKNKNIYSYNARLNAKGGNEYFEMGFAHPEIVLADLITILHPELLPGRKLYFFEKLK